MEHVRLCGEESRGAIEQCGFGACESHTTKDARFFPRRTRLDVCALIIMKKQQMSQLHQWE